MYEDDYNTLMEEIKLIQANNEKGEGLHDDDLNTLVDFIYFMYNPDHLKTENGTQWKIIKSAIAVMDFLLVKNNRYGNSALKPIRCFSKIDASQQINNRMDDKLMRIKNSEEERKNDFVDMTGYLHLKLVDRDWLDLKDLLD